MSGRSTRVPTATRSEMSSLVGQDVRLDVSQAQMRADGTAKVLQTILASHLLWRYPLPNFGSCSGVRPDERPFIDTVVDRVEV
jgi:hypothetical protein